jgi:uncharacterized protein
LNATAPHALRSAHYYMMASLPRSPQAHLIESPLGRHLFLPDGSRLFDADPKLFAQLDTAMTERGVGDLLIGEVLDRFGLRGAPFIDDAPLDSPPIHALSLAIAQKCNLG